MPATYSKRWQSLILILFWKFIPNRFSGQTSQLILQFLRFYFFLVSIPCMMPSIFSERYWFLLQFLKLPLISSSIFLSYSGLCKYCLDFLRMRLKQEKMMSPTTNPMAKMMSKTMIVQPQSMQTRMVYSRSRNSWQAMLGSSPSDLFRNRISRLSVTIEVSTSLLFLWTSLLWSTNARVVTRNYEPSIVTFLDPSCRYWPSSTEEYMSGLWPRMEYLVGDSTFTSATLVLGKDMILLRAVLSISLFISASIRILALPLVGISSLKAISLVSLLESDSWSVQMSVSQMTPSSRPAMRELIAALLGMQKSLVAGMVRTEMSLGSVFDWQNTFRRWSRLGQWEVADEAIILSMQGQLQKVEVLVKKYIQDRSYLGQVNVEASGGLTPFLSLEVQRVGLVLKCSYTLYTSVTISSQMSTPELIQDSALLIISELENSQNASVLKALEVLPEVTTVEYSTCMMMLIMMKVSREHMKNVKASFRLKDNWFIRPVILCILLSLGVIYIIGRNTGEIGN